tara:strand:+ start:4472 stop:4969 length:498 start_codon:yes stop_codon:yes gene_type:complete
MWIIIKFKQNQFYTLKQEFKKKLEIEPNFFFPKLKFQKIKKNKLISYPSPLLGDYIFCFHPKFNNENILRNINYLKGVKFFLNGFRTYQKDILNFIERCRSSEDENGYIKQTFFNFVAIEKIKFLSGPFTNIIFKILKRQKDSMKVSDGNVNISFSTKHYLFEAA